MQIATLLEKLIEIECALVEEKNPTLRDLLLDARACAARLLMEKTNKVRAAAPVFLGGF
ncbi:MAG: hypothetical protein WCC26_06760 [Terracidiphilus sp.]